MKTTVHFNLHAVKLTYILNYEKGALFALLFN